MLTIVQGQLVDERLRFSSRDTFVTRRFVVNEIVIREQIRRRRLMEGSSFGVLR